MKHIDIRRERTNSFLVEYDLVKQLHGASLDGIRIQVFGSLFRSVDRTIYPVTTLVVPQ